MPSDRVYAACNEEYLVQYFRESDKHVTVYPLCDFF